MTPTINTARRDSVRKETNRENEASILNFDFLPDRLDDGVEMPGGLDDLDARRGPHPAIRIAQKVSLFIGLYSYYAAYNPDSLSLTKTGCTLN